MKAIAVIERPAVVRQILDLLGLPTAPLSFRAPPDQPDGLAAHRPREWSYEPFSTCLCVARRQAGALPFSNRARRSTTHQGFNCISWCRRTVGDHLVRAR